MMIGPKSGQWRDLGNFASLCARPAEAIRTRPWRFHGEKSNRQDRKFAKVDNLRIFIAMCQIGLRRRQSG